MSQFLDSANVIVNGPTNYVTDTYQADDFKLVDEKTVAEVWVDASEYPGVIRAVKSLVLDIERVTRRVPVIRYESNGSADYAVIVGTIGKSPLIDRLVREQKLDVTGIVGQWESFIIQVTTDPLPGVAKGLVIAGSDKRGTIYGVYDVSRQIGVSPWYWWADVTPQRQGTLIIKNGRYQQGEPSVKYRGIFLNDEAPALTRWVNQTFGGYNHRFYEQVFELLLRLKANYLWPAMWDAAFNDDDPLNPLLADDYGIVMGTSHHEPMLRAQMEWERYGTGPWNYQLNQKVLSEFWDEGIERGKNWESIITLGMRGNGDEPMPGEDLRQNIELMYQIIADQRRIIAKHMNTDVTKVPQLWALYKEVQEYYEQGMQVPDDVTLLWSDDNWGNLRRLPTAEERKRSGGAGIYYHFDYVGGPRSYKWVNTIPLTKIWEQMNLAYDYGADRIWIVNVGDLKPMEFPMEFFLTLAWDIRRWTKDNLFDYAVGWAQREFGIVHAPDIADILLKYTKYNGMRKPELLEPDTFSLVDYQEAEQLLANWRDIAQKAEKLYELIPDAKKDAFFELVLYPTKACAQLTELYITVGKNRLYASQHRSTANLMADRAEMLFKADADLAQHYNKVLAAGKWDHMMDQTHIGYSTWQQPYRNRMPEVQRLEIAAGSDMGVAVEGSTEAWTSGRCSLPPISVYTRESRYIDIINRKGTPFEFTAVPGQSWIKLSLTQATVDPEQRIWVVIDWDSAPSGDKVTGSVAITGPEGKTVTVEVSIFNPPEPAREQVKGFVESNGYVAMETLHFTVQTDWNGLGWCEISDYGRTQAAMAVFPTMVSGITLPESPCLEYQMYLFTTGQVKVTTYIAPSLNFLPGTGLRFGISVDNEPVQIVSPLQQNPDGSFTDVNWDEAVKDNVRKITTTHQINGVGYHRLRIYMIDPGVVLQKIVVDTGGVRPSYFGPPESFYNPF